MAPYQETNNNTAVKGTISSPNISSGESSSAAAVPSLQLTQSEDMIDDENNITASAQPNYNNEDREVMDGQRCSSTSSKEIETLKLMTAKSGGINDKMPDEQSKVQSENDVEELEADENDMHDTISRRRSSSDSLSHIQFKDPFPSLSMQSSGSSTNASGNVAQQRRRIHENNNKSTAQQTQPSPLRTIPQFDTNQPSKLQSNTSSISEGLYTPPPFSYYDTSPPHSQSNTPQPPDRSPIQTVCNNIKKIWLDPFPTPDVSVCSSRKSYNNTPCSSRIRNDDDADDNIDGRYADNNIVMGASDSWNKILSVPIIPPIEELDISPEKDSNHSVQKSSRVSKSSPRLHQSSNSAAAVDNILPSIRKVASDGALFPMMKRPSMEDIWGALQSGPDGNELDVDNSDDNNEGKKRLSWNESFEHNNRGQQKDLQQHNSTVTPKASLHKSYTTPLNTSWDDQVGLRRRTVGDNNHSINNDDDRQIIDTNRVKQQQQVANSHTITNVTGANLAKEVKLLMKQRESPNKGTMTPGRLQRVVRKASTFVITPVKTRVQKSSQHAVKLVRSTQQKLKERKERRRQRRLARMKEPPRSWWIVIPSDHPYKIAWDVLTMLWAILGAYRTHVRIRDREFDQSPLIILTEIWFTLDILLNFVTEHKTRKGEVIRDGKSIWARYLTTWFIIDILSLESPR